MTPSELKSKTLNTVSYFFTRNTMKFFGDTMKNYGVKETTINTWTRKNVKVFELYRKNPVKYGLQLSAYFTVSDFRQAFIKQ